MSWHGCPSHLLVKEGGVGLNVVLINVISIPFFSLKVSLIMFFNCQATGIGDWDWGLGNGEWGMGNGKMGNREYPSPRR